MSEPTRNWGLGLIPPLLVGGWLRWFRVREQILVWDELHTVTGALEMPLREIFRTWTLESGDYCVPLAAFFHVLMNHGIQLSEMGFRAPVLLAGLVSLIAIPLGLAPRIGRGAAVVLAWLVAVSPVLVLYSRIVRSYMPIVLLGFAAVVAFERWWRTRSRRAGAAYVVLAASAVYFHLGAVPFVMAPFAYAAVGTLLRGRRWCEIVPIAVLLGSVTLAIGALLFPARESLADLVQSHRGGHLPELRTWLELGRMWTGTSAVPLAALTAVFALRGVWVIFKKDHGFLLYLFTLATGHVAGLAILAPIMLERLLVANRYLLVLLPFGLALAAAGLAAPWFSRRSGWGRAVQGVGIASLLLALVAFGPLATEDFRRSQFTHHPRFMEFTLPRNWVSKDAVPRFYRDLGAESSHRDEGIVEYPWVNVGSLTFYAYQRVHQRQIRVAPPVLNLLDRRVVLRYLVAPTPEAFLRSGARYVVVHMDLRSELRRLSGERMRGHRHFWSSARSYGARMAKELRDRWGPPALTDGSIRVWDLQATARR